MILTPNKFYGPEGRTVGGFDSSLPFPYRVSNGAALAGYKGSASCMKTVRSPASAGNIFKPGLS
ncbi:MAG: hypothetical protein WKF88_05170 [Ferruginibacter sp.]